MIRQRLLLPTLLLLAACSEQSDGTLGIDGELVKAQLWARQAAEVSKGSLTVVRPYITGEKELAALKDDTAVHQTVIKLAESAKGAGAGLLADLEGLELDSSRPLGACRDALVSSTKLLGDFATHAQDGRSPVGLLPQLDAADQDVRRCADTSASLGLPFMGQP